ncbi:CBS domain-containing protein [Aurantivibrio plasticivorans]
MQISLIMTKNPVSIAMDNPMSEVKDIFEKTQFHHLLVVDEGILVGVISDRDLLGSISPTAGTAVANARDTATLNKRVRQVMSRQLITLGPTASFYDAIALFNKHPISCIPIVDEDNHPLGIVSWRDIMRAIKLK